MVAPHPKKAPCGSFRLNRFILRLHRSGREISPVKTSSIEPRETQNIHPSRTLERFPGRRLQLPLGAAKDRLTGPPTAQELRHRPDALVPELTHLREERRRLSHLCYSRPSKVPGWLGGPERPTLDGRTKCETGTGEGAGFSSRRGGRSSRKQLRSHTRPDM